MRIHIQPAIQIDAQERIQRFVSPPVFGDLNGVAQVDPDAVAYAIVVVVDVPAADDIPNRNCDVAVFVKVLEAIETSSRNRKRIRITAVEVWVVLANRSQTDLSFDRRDQRR